MVGLRSQLRIVFTSTSVVFAICTPSHKARGVRLHGERHTEAWILSKDVIICHGLSVFVTLKLWFDPEVIYYIFGVNPAATPVIVYRCFVSARFAKTTDVEVKTIRSCDLNPTTPHQISMSRPVLLVSQPNGESMRKVYLFTRPRQSGLISEASAILSYFLKTILFSFQTPIGDFHHSYIHQLPCPPLLFQHSTAQRPRRLSPSRWAQIIRMIH